MPIGDISNLVSLLDVVNDYPICIHVVLYNQYVINPIRYRTTPV